MGTGTRGYRVYIIDVMPRWYHLVAPGIAPGKKCFYVGQTGKDVSERYREHRVGVRYGRRAKRPVEVFRKIRAAKDGADLINKVDVKLRRTMVEQFAEMPSVDEVGVLEASLVDELRAAGHVVYPRGLGQIPFKA